MKKRNNAAALGRFLKLLYLKFYRSNDTPQRLAIGFGLGVALGIMPGLGIIAAIVMSGLLRVNRVTTLLGTLATNTWLSFVTLALSTKVGSLILGLEWHEVYQQWVTLIKHFSFSDLFKSTFLDIVLPMVLGFIIVSLCLGIIAYLIALPVILKIKQIKNRPKTPR